MSVAIENFIKAIYNNSIEDNANTKPSTIAKKLGTTSAAATDMAKKLASKDLINYQKYQKLTLTDKGKKMALEVIRKHRLWESLLFKLFDMSLHEIHREAELLEHETSAFLANKISAFLGHPKFDPHGEPIPNSEGKITTIDTSITLALASENTSYTIAKLTSDDKDFFDFCLLNNLKYGSNLQVIKQFTTSKMTQISINNSTLLLHENFTKQVFVNPKL